MTALTNKKTALPANIGRSGTQTRSRTDANANWPTPGRAGVTGQVRRRRPPNE